MSLSIVVIAKSTDLDQVFLGRLKFADEILIISDSPVINEPPSGKYRYIHRPLNNDFASQRNFALSKTTSEWIFFVDTDELISKQLASEIIKIIENKNNKFNGFMVRRIDTVFNRLILHGETGNNKILRLARMDSGKFSRSVHEHWSVSGRVGELLNPLFHNKDHFISEFIGRISLYGPIDAINLSKEGKPFSIFRLLAYPKTKFIQNYFFRKGLLDGYIGLFQAYLMAIQSLSVRVFQWESQK